MMMVTMFMFGPSMMGVKRAPLPVTVVLKQV